MKLKCFGLLLTLLVAGVRSCSYANPEGKFTCPRLLNVGDHRPFLFPVPPLPEGLYRLCLQSVDTVEVGQNTSLLFSVQ